MIAAESIAGSDYEGWVAWVDDSPIFEMVPALAGMGFAPVIAGAIGLPYRPVKRNVLDWKHVPTERVSRLELYFARERTNRQPLFRLDREPGADELRFIQFKMSGMVIHGRRDASSAYERLGVIGYKVGYFNPRIPECKLWEYVRDGHRFLGARRSATAPAPVGFGLAPAALGMS